jgi:methylmalonyl-CoA mutase
VGQDGHDRGARVIATSFADLGFDVDVRPMFQIPAEVARQAIDNDVHIIGISSHAGAHLSLAPEVLRALKASEAQDIRIVCGGSFHRRMPHFSSTSALPPSSNQGRLSFALGPGEAAAELVRLFMDGR